MRYRKKPVIIEALQWTGTNIKEVMQFAEDMIYIHGSGEDIKLCVKTIEGTEFLKHGDYIIKGTKEEFYPCKPDIFEMTYEKLME